MRTQVVLAIILNVAGSAAAAEIEWLGRVSISGSANDLSALEGRLPGGTALNQFGGWSALDHISGNRYVLLSDRGPLDGAVPYPVRMHIAEIDVIPGDPQPVRFRLTATMLLKNGKGVPFVGLANVTTTTSERLDPEGVRVVSREPLEMVVTDEYGPHIVRVNADGQELTRWSVPAHCQPSKSTPNPMAATASLQGRQDNGGLEGVAMTPSMNELWTIFQRPLLQDHAVVRKTRTGVNCRVLKYALHGTQQRVEEYIYQLDAPGSGVSEILAVDATRFLVLERDGERGVNARIKRIYLADATHATEVSQVESLPAADLPAEVRPLKKVLLVDFLSADSLIPLAEMPEKFEGLTFGPPLADGRSLLLICVDNDFVSTQPSQLIAMAIRW